MIFPSFLLPFILWTLGAGLATALLTVYVRRQLIARAVFDMPNDRSMHKTPVPRGGGLALLLVLFVTLCALLVPYSLLTRQALLLPALFLLFFVSWLDDRRGAGVGFRLGAHLLAAILGVCALPDQALLFDGFLPPLAERALIVLGWTWFMNLYNFMDGIDGITGIETLCLGLGCALVFLALRLDDPLLLPLCAALIGASAGFLTQNWHPAKIFMGDVGSVPLGFLTGFLLLKVALAGALTAALILPLYYLVDSGITITRRALRGEKIWKPHREHFYQKAAARLGNHARVVWRVGLANMALIGMALVSLKDQALGALGAIAIVACLLATMHKGRPAASGDNA